MISYLLNTLFLLSSIFITNTEPIVTANIPTYENLALISSPQANQFATGEGVLVAMVDSGITASHPEYANTKITGWNILHDDADYTDKCYHGTQAAGPLVKVAPDIDLMMIKAFEDEACISSFSAIANGIRYAVDNGAQIINLSVGGATTSTIVQEAVVYAYLNNVFVVASAGNDGSEGTFYPAMANHVFAVSGSDNKDRPYIRTNFGKHIKVSAPALRIWVPFYIPDTGEYTYNLFSGTSASAPHVSGLAALLLQLKPDLTVDELADIITSSSQDIYAVGYDIVTGYGRINAFNAIVFLAERYDVYDEIGLYLTRMPQIRN